MPPASCRATQLVALQSLSIYFDTDKPLLDPGKKWSLLDASEWDDLLLPSDQRHVGPDAHQFLLAPVDGRMRYVRRGPAARVLVSDAAQEFDLQLGSISAGLHHMQYVSAGWCRMGAQQAWAGCPKRGRWFVVCTRAWSCQRSPV